MDFDDFEISQEDLSRIENIEITLLNQSFQISTDEDHNIQLSRPKRRRIISSDSESSETEINRAIQVLAESSRPSTWTDPKEQDEENKADRLHRALRTLFEIKAMVSRSLFDALFTEPKVIIEGVVVMLMHIFKY
ncbi:unnamed protein product [Arctia plantaginis]|uniref:Uncharacterized protein n=1 Tax=Arctia plantaginis TaxID=874455 RepID=A0A8S1B8R6_ARCPL|nr:unnamed protein product [Arctia plantaginis]